MKKSTKRFALSTIIFGFAGYLTGILTAPKSGKETREEIKETATQSITATEKQLKVLHTELNTLIAETKLRTETVTGKAKTDLDAAMLMPKQVKEKARELLSAMHEGNVDDKDLQKSVVEAKKAIASLKSYLKK